MSPNIIQRTLELRDGVLRYANGNAYKWVIGADMAKAILAALKQTSRHPEEYEGEHDRITLTKLHGYRVEIGGPSDEIRFMGDDEEA